MDMNELMQNVTKLTGDEFEKKFNKLIRENYKYKNLDSGNRQVILDFVKRYKERFREGLGLSEERFKDEMYEMDKKRSELGLTEEDMKDVREILGELKR